MNEPFVVLPVLFAKIPNGVWSKYPSESEALDMLEKGQSFAASQGIRFVPFEQRGPIVRFIEDGTPEVASAINQCYWQFIYYAIEEVEPEDVHLYDSVPG